MSIMTWQRYEKAILEKYIREFLAPAFRVEPVGDAPFSFMGRHSGVPRQLDVAVFRAGASHPFLVVDAKHWEGRLDVADIEAFLGLVDDVDAQLGVLVASSGFSKSSHSRVKGARQPIDLQIISAEDALRYDWLRAGRALFPADWAFHERLGEALRLIEVAGDVAAISEVLESVAFEEWETFVMQALRKQLVEANAFLRWVARWHFDDGWRFNAIRILSEEGLLDEAFRAELLLSERDPDTCQLLHDTGE
jgi:hypothetical protein